MFLVIQYYSNIVTGYSGRLENGILADYLQEKSRRTRHDERGG